MKKDQLMSVYVVALALLLTGECWAANTGLLPQDAPVDRALLNITEDSNQRQVEIPLWALQGKSLEAITASLHEAFEILTQDDEVDKDYEILIQRDGTGQSVKTARGIGNTPDPNGPPREEQDVISQLLNQDALMALAPPSGNEIAISAADTGCAVVIGRVKFASGAKEYPWKSMDLGMGAIAYWPTFLPPQIPNDTYTGNWYGATGANFWGQAKVPSNWFISVTDSIATGLVFQYNLPRMSCDATVQWYAEGYAYGSSWYLKADWGRIDTDWMRYVSPVGETFPSTVKSYQFYAPGLYKSASGYAVTSNKYVFNEAFTGRAGESPRIYLGLSLMLMLRNGVADTLYGTVSERFTFPDGIFYLAMPR